MVLLLLQKCVIPTKEIAGHSCSYQFCLCKMDHFQINILLTLLNRSDTQTHRHTYTHTNTHKHTHTHTHTHTDKHRQTHISNHIGSTKCFGCSIQVCFHLRYLHQYIHLPFFQFYILTQILNSYSCVTKKCKALYF